MACHITLPSKTASEAWSSPGIIFASAASAPSPTCARLLAKQTEIIFWRQPETLAMFMPPTA
ncbi:uncharacterized protein TrAtP1_007353 [Trichoderma atroviride]|uniref:uncharacterized protein n=1 Tax=Hypocrea atroviridis TaxID=63577 RepID=UPI00332B6525|nr:hypothetical protein TrAtP1_007353 [Trichoderma atroviride]